MSENRHQLAFLDGLRGFASLWVLIGHVMFITGYKFGLFAQPDLAVEVFIIISGFLMTFHYQLRQDREPWDAPGTWKVFWVRRFFRIAPLYYVCLLVAFLFGPLIWEARLHAVSVFPGGVEETMRYADRYLDQSLTNIFLHVSFLFGMTYTNNFQTPLPDWSIGLEMQYYLFFPFIMLLALRLGKIPGLLLLVGLMWALGRFLDHSGFVKGAYSMLPMKFHLFAAGMFVAMSLKAQAKTRWLYLAAAIAVVFVPLGGGRDFLHRAIKIGIVLGFFALLYRDRMPTLASRALGALDYVFANRLSRWIGDLSYGVYLIHLLVLMPVAASFAAYWPELGNFLRFWFVLAFTIGITYALAWLAYRFVEQPGIALGRKVAACINPAKPAFV